MTEVGRAVQCRHSFPFFLASLILASYNATHKGVRLSMAQLGLSHTALIRKFFFNASQEGAQDRIDHIIKSLIFIFLLKIWTSLQYFPLF